MEGRGGGQAPNPNQTPPPRTHGQPGTGTAPTGTPEPREAPRLPSHPSRRRSRTPDLWGVSAVGWLSRGGHPWCQPPWHRGALHGTSFSGTIRTRCHRWRVPPGSCHRAAGTCLTPLAWDRQLRVAVPAGDSRVPSPPKHPNVPTAPWPSPGHLLSPTGHTPPRATALPGRRFAGTSRAGCCPDVPSVPRRAHPRVPAGSLAGGRASERGYPVPGSGVPANPLAMAQGDGRCRAGRSGTGTRGGRV